MEEEGVDIQQIQAAGGARIQRQIEPDIHLKAVLEHVLQRTQRRSFGFLSVETVNLC